MTKLARLPKLERAGSREPAKGHAPRLRTRYYAFLSYSHLDKELADWLHRELEKFRVPNALAGKLTANGVVPRRLTPIFRDQHDLSAGDDLAVEIEAALAASQFLIVLCSPTAAKSRWTNLEIESFKRTRPEGCVLAAVAAGEPFASDIPGRQDEECFPPALRYKYDRRGHRTQKRAEPLAADFRESAGGRRLGFLKLVAGMLGVGLDELVQREQTRRQRRLALLAAASLGGMAVTSTLAVTAIHARDAAREQRRQAEGLIGFMVGDLKDKLEPIGRLDALDGVGARVLAYYSKEDMGELSDAALLQRASALRLMGEVANARGHLDEAKRLYSEAMTGTAEALRRNPNDPQRLFEHAQNVFYVGSIAEEQSDFQTAETAAREYKRLANGMVALAPDNLKYRMEVQYADIDLAVALSDQRRFAEAAGQYQEALNTIEAISTADPSNQDYRKSVAESLAWLADAQNAVGKIDAAIATRQRDVALLDGLLARTGSVEFHQRLIPAHRALGNLYAERGQSDAAIAEFREAIEHADVLRAIEPANAQWLTYGSGDRLDLSRQLLASNQPSEAAAQAQVACQTVQRLLKQDKSNPELRKALASCFTIQAQIALKSGAKPQALEFARQSVAAAQLVHTHNTVADRLLKVKPYLVLGDVERELGDLDAARDAWASALAAIPANIAERPYEIADHAKVLARLGRQSEAMQLQSKLQAMGYHRLEL